MRDGYLFGFIRLCMIAALFIDSSVLGINLSFYTEQKRNCIRTSGMKKDRESGVKEKKSGSREELMEDVKIVEERDRSFDFKSRSYIVELVEIDSQFREVAGAEKSHLFTTVSSLISQPAPCIVRKFSPGAEFLLKFIGKHSEFMAYYSKIKQWIESGNLKCTAIEFKCTSIKETCSDLYESPFLTRVEFKNAEISVTSIKNISTSSTITDLVISENSKFVYEDEGDFTDPVVIPNITGLHFKDSENTEKMFQLLFKKILFVDLKSLTFDNAFIKNFSFLSDLKNNKITDFRIERDSIDVAGLIANIGYLKSLQKLSVLSYNGNTTDLPSIPYRVAGRIVTLEVHKDLYTHFYTNPFRKRIYSKLIENVSIFFPCSRKNNVYTPGIFLHTHYDYKTRKLRIYPNYEIFKWVKDPDFHYPFANYIIDTIIIELDLSEKKKIRNYLTEIEYIMSIYKESMYSYVVVRIKKPVTKQINQTFLYKIAGSLSPTHVNMYLIPEPALEAGTSIINQIVNMSIQRRTEKNPLQPENPKIDILEEDTFVPEEVEALALELSANPTDDQSLHYTGRYLQSFSESPQPVESSHIILIYHRT